MCLSTWVKINGVKAFTLFDSGSTSDAISPDFVPVANIHCFELTNPVILQLGMKGSRSTINHGSLVNFKFGTLRHELVGHDYFNIANVNRYDLIISMVFMCKHGISLHFASDLIKWQGMSMPTLLEGEEVQELA